MSAPGPVRQQLINLLGAYGYNLYDAKNRMRADDLLVREQAAGAVADAAGALRDLRTAYHHRFIPPASREQPFPPAERTAALTEIARLQRRASDLDTMIRNASVPGSDHVWERFRREQEVLSELLLADYNLIVPARELRDTALALTPETWSVETASSLDRMMSRIESAVRARSTFPRM